MTDTSNQVLAQFFNLTGDDLDAITAYVQSGRTLADLIGGGADLSDYSGSQIHLTATDSAEGAGIRLDSSTGDILLDDDAGVSITSSVSAHLIAATDVTVAGGSGHVKVDTSTGIELITTVADGNVIVEATNGEINLLAARAVQLNSDDTSIIGNDTLILQAPAIGFFDATPVVQAVAPVTLGDVITLLQNYGLAAT